MSSFYQRRVFWKFRFEALWFQSNTNALHSGSADRKHRRLPLDSDRMRRQQLGVTNNEQNERKEDDRRAASAR